MRLPFLLPLFALTACSPARAPGAPSPVEVAQREVTALRDAAERYRASKRPSWPIAQLGDPHAAELCPSFAALKEAKLLDASAAAKDPWGHPYRIECTSQAYRVLSAGPDEVWNTGDDLRSDER